jgi:hypothetical protein
MQTVKEIPEGTIVDLAAPGGSVRGCVNSCTSDDFGYLVEISIDPASPWFPASYHPPYIQPNDAA